MNKELIMDHLRATLLEVWVQMQDAYKKLDAVH